MKKIFWLSILKSVSLVVLTAATAVFIFTSYITLLQYYIYLGICSLLYVGFQVSEINLQSILNKKETTVYTYKTDATVAKYLLRAILFLMAGLVFFGQLAGFSARELALENLRMDPPSESASASWSEDDQADAVFGEPPAFSNYERMRYGRMDYNSANWSW